MVRQTGQPWHPDMATFPALGSGTAGEWSCRLRRTRLARSPVIVQAVLSPHHAQNVARMVVADLADPENRTSRRPRRRDSWARRAGTLTGVSRSAWDGPRIPHE